MTDHTAQEFDMTKLNIDEKLKQLLADALAQAFHQGYETGHQIGYEKGWEDCRDNIIRVLHDQGWPIKQLAKEPDPFLATRIDYLRDTRQLTERAANCLLRADIRDVAMLLTKTEDDLLNITNFGRISLDAIKTLLDEHGFTLK